MECAVDSRSAVGQLLSSRGGLVGGFEVGKGGAGGVEW